jgi:hypothetical protein
VWWTGGAGSHQLLPSVVTRGSVEGGLGQAPVYHNPRLAFLDEATSAVSEDLVCIMYKEKGITLVSVGHRGSLRQFHQKVLSLGKCGRSKMQGVDSYNSMQSLVVENTP